MHYSSFVVTTTPPHLAEVRRDLEAIPGVEVRHWHEASGRLVVIHEGVTIRSQEEALHRIQSHPRVLVAGLFYHLLDSPLESEGTAATRKAPAPGELP